MQSCTMHSQYTAYKHCTTHTCARLLNQSRTHAQPAHTHPMPPRIVLTLTPHAQTLTLTLLTVAVHPSHALTLATHHTTQSHHNVHLDYTQHVLALTPHTPHTHSPHAQLALHHTIKLSHLHHTSHPPFHMLTVTLHHTLALHHLVTPCTLTL